MSYENDEIFDPKNEAKANWVKWGKVSDQIKGTLVDIREIVSQLPGKEGQKVKVYEFLMHFGTFHQLDETNQPIEPPVEIKHGEYWIVGGKPGIDNAMRNVRIGQIVGMRFAEIKSSKTKGFAPQKMIKVYPGGMDPNYMGQGAADVDMSQDNEIV